MTTVDHSPARLSGGLAVGAAGVATAAAGTATAAPFGFAGVIVLGAA